LAESAFVHLLTKMRHLVKFENMVVTKSLATDVASIWFLPRVCPNVDLKLLGASEPLVAGCADIGLLASMCPHVYH